MKNAKLKSKLRELCESKIPLLRKIIRDPDTSGEERVKLQHIQDQITILVREQEHRKAVGLS